MTRNTLKAIALLAATVLSSAPALAQDTAGPTIATSDGNVMGVREGEVDAFLGIPFAAPPVGENRWRAPQPVSPWTGTRWATEFGDNCIQPLGQGEYGPWTHEYVVTDDFSEDCLFLNVWRPADAAPDADLPVFVWIHGGGFTAGSGSVPIYNGRNLATKDMVVVTINYRLGPLGFLALPELTEEAGDGVVSNFGIQDQIAALQWVQQNIGQFGGDADNVTIAGQSAGSMAVHTLVASPLAAGLFDRAIAQAGLPAPGRTSAGPDEAEEAGQQFMEFLGQNTLADMRALPAEAFLPQPGQNRIPIRFSVVVDGVLLNADPGTAVMEGTANDVPMMVGQNADEALGTPPATGETSAADWQAALQEAFGDHADAIGSLYPSSTGLERSASLREIQRDRAYAAIWQWGAARGETNDSPLYVYLFDHIEPGPNSEQWRSFHSNEIPYIFGTLDMSPERGFTFEDWQVSLTASDLWANFAKTGVPMIGAPAFDEDDPQRIRIQAQAMAEAMLTPQELAAYNAFVEDGGHLSPMFR